MSPVIYFFSDGDIDFPAATADTFGTAAETELFQGNVFSKPGIGQYLGGGAGTGV